MSQLYDLKCGGVGSYNDIVKEQFAIFLGHLLVAELETLTLKLMRTPNARYINEVNILSRAHITLSILTKESVERAIIDIADILFIKTRPGNDAAKKKTVAVIKEYIPLAIINGYKDEDGILKTILS